MDRFEDQEISKAILCTYHERLLERITSDVIIAGAGPAGMTAAILLARQGFKVTILEKRLSPGGGIWGGGMGLSQVVIQQAALPLLDDFGIRYKPCGEGLYATDAVELAAGLSYRAIQAGAELFNLMTIEDICFHNQQVTGVVVNRTMISGHLPVDPIMFTGKAVVDTTGHEAVMVATLRKRGVLSHPTDATWPCEGPMDAATGEAFVAEKACEVFPGLWIAGMSVSATLGGPRMGPIFGGMLLSGARVAKLIAEAVEPSAGDAS